jgi:uncharacterized protein
MVPENTAVEIRDDREHGKPVAYEDGSVVGCVAYFAMHPEPGASVAVHTVVEPEHEGKGIAGALARAFYAMAAPSRGLCHPPLLVRRQVGPAPFGGSAGGR